MHMIGWAAVAMSGWLENRNKQQCFDNSHSESQHLHFSNKLQMAYIQLLPQTEKGESIKSQHTYLYNTYTPLQKYWNSEANSFIFAVDWKHLGLTSKDEYEMRD